MGVFNIFINKHNNMEHGERDIKNKTVLALVVFDLMQNKKQKKIHSCKASWKGERMPLQVSADGEKLCMCERQKQSQTEKNDSAKSPNM